MEYFKASKISDENINKIRRHRFEKFITWF